MWSNPRVLCRDRDGVNTTVYVGRHGCQKDLTFHMSGFELECMKGKPLALSPGRALLKSDWVKTINK
jgi:hypothetical protein